MSKERRACFVIEILIILALAGLIIFIVISYKRAGGRNAGGYATVDPLAGDTIAEKILMAEQSNPARTASWYSVESCQKEGSSGFTASGEKFFDEGPTCAMRSRDFGRYYRVTNVSNGKSVVVRHNDFGPSKRLHDQGRIVDLSKGAFRRIADLREGVVRVRVERI